MEMRNYTIRNISLNNLKTAIDWADREGWNPGLHDAIAFYETDPTGFFMGFIGDEPVSCISAVSYKKKFGFLGLYIVRREFRGKGLGLAIWKKALSYLGSQNIGLDGVIAQQENYKKSGFKIAYKNMRFQGRSFKSNKISEDIVKLSEIPIEEICDYDSKHFPVERPLFIRNWIKMPYSFSLGIVRCGKLKGYGVIRKCRKGYKIGPLFADNKDYAEGLLIALINKIEKDSDFYLDIPEVNQDALNLVKKRNMNFVFETARMYSKEAPDLPMHKIFGVTTLELG